jgi:prepilin-type N-terminal cleavage/methylation domain-containing protein
MTNFIDKKQTGFTLAEVLITLLIIGVVASLVIPSIVNDTQEAEIKTSVKKNYSIISQAAKLFIIDNGGSIKGLCSSGDDVTRDICIRDQFLNYMSYTKKCSRSPEPDSWNNCFVKSSYWGGDWKNIDGSAPTVGYDATAILNDGTLIHFWQADPNCNFSGTRMCSRIIFDINGLKGPNITGKDIFAIWLYDDGIKPYGISGQPSIDFPGAEKTLEYLKQ